jgi:hypothetical protein
LAIDPDGFGIETTTLSALDPPMSFRRSKDRLSGENQLVKVRSQTILRDDKHTEYFPLKEILETPHYRKYFKLFCASEYSPENLMFYEAVHAFQDSKDIAKHANQIYSVFFEKGSDLEVNVEHSVRKVIEDALSEPTQDMYDVPLEKVTGTCLVDQYFRFIYSPYYAQMIEKKTFGSFLLLK